MADRHANKGEQHLELQLEGLSARARTGDTFQQFTELLMSMKKVNDNKIISICTKMTSKLTKKKKSTSSIGASPSLSAFATREVDTTFHQTSKNRSSGALGSLSRRRT